MDKKGHGKAAVQLLDASKRRIEKAVSHLDGISEEAGDVAMSIFNRIELLKAMVKKEYL